ncbi:MAG: LPXTG cell wall anchor domain-containing protein [Thermoleophilia bacterium]|nr:LPXTG cell wall anchor domain-containing protein [Thermoleophilia bacterium]
MKKKRVGHVCVLMGVFVLMLLFPAVVFSQELPACAGSDPLPPGWSITPTSGPPGTAVTVIGDHGYPDVDYYVYFRPTGELLASETHVVVIGTTGYTSIWPEAFSAFGIYDFVYVDNQTGSQYCLSFELIAPVQADAYTHAAESLPASLPSTGLMLLAPLVGFLAMGAGGYIIRKRNC